MKKTICLLFSIALLCGIFQSCTPDVKVPGSIYGVVADKVTGEPIKSAGVELSPVGLKTITGSEGQFEFTELDPGKYTLLVTKTGYIDAVSNTIEVKAGQTAKGDIQLEGLHLILKVINDNREEISILDFGSSEDDVARSFNLFNDGTEAIDWKLTVTADWIASVSKKEGTLAAGAIQSLLITIDRTKLSSGLNQTTIHITSNGGNKQLTVTATNSFQPTTLNTFPPTDVKTTSATFNGEILMDGTPKYIERGFVYSESSMPTISNTIKKITSPITNEKAYSATVTGLREGATYYVRAYAINGGKEAYSTNEVSFVATGNAMAKVLTKSVMDIDPQQGRAMFVGEVLDAGDPAYTERGFVYGTTANSTVYATKVQVAGGGIGEYSAQVSQLQMGSTYYVRAYAINTVGVAYGDEQTFTMQKIGAPVVTTNIATNIDYTSATIGGNVTSDGGAAITERGICYSSATSNPTIEDYKKTSGRGMGSFTINLTGLASGTTYYVRAYAINENDISYGECVTFTTKELTYEAVDMGLSVQWATFNIGATQPEEYGDYFAWGETVPKDEYTWLNYKHCYGSATSLTKYCSSSTFGLVDNKEILESEDDAAQMNWGANWRMPTLDELKELKENCGWSVVTINGVRCNKATSYINGNSIIFPLAGCKEGGALNWATYDGYYWGSKSYGNSAASFLSLGTDVSNNSTYGSGQKCYGFSVRPVCP